MKVWLYYAKAGGGHLGPAKALAAAFTKKFAQNASFVWFDLGKEGGSVVQSLLENGYTTLVHCFPWLYALLYEINRFRLIMWLENTIAGWFLTKKIVHSLQTESPDVIVATYFLVGPIRRALAKMNYQIPVIVVVTEPYSAPAIWFFYPELIYIVASEEVRAIALQAGVLSKNIQLMPQIVQEQLAFVDLKEGVLTLVPDKKTVLLVGGGNGFPHLEEMLSSLSKANLQAQYIVVCGTNERQRQRVTALSKKLSASILVYGFVDFLPALISRADVVVTKAGANMVREILLQQKPLIIAHYIWGQEKGTMQHVVRNGFGFYEPNPRRLPERVSDCLFKKETQEQIKKAQQNAKLVNGAPDAVVFIAGVVSLTQGG